MNTQPQPSEWDDDKMDAPMQDPGVTDAEKAAGCSVRDEIRTMEAQTQ